MPAADDPVLQTCVLHRDRRPDTSRPGLHLLGIELLGDGVVEQSEYRELANTFDRLARSAAVIGSARTGSSQFVDGPGFPLYIDLGEALRHVDRANRDRLDREAQHRFAIRRCRGGGTPDRRKILGQRADPNPVLVAQLHATLALCVLEAVPDLLKVLQPRFPFALERAGDDSVVGVDGLVTPLCAARLVLRLLQTELPLFL